MDLTIYKTTYNVDDLRWLGSREGTDTARSVTLTKSTFTVNADGFIPSGTPLAVDGTTGRYKLWTTGTALAGFLLTPVRASAPVGVTAAVGTAQPNPVGPMIDRGRINLDFIPAPAAGTVKAADAATAPRFTFVGTFAAA